MQTTTYAIESYDVKEFPLLSVFYEEDALDVFITATARSVRSDYGVPGSPVWDEIEDVEIEEYEINGVGYSPKEVIKKWGADAEDTLHQICADRAVEMGEWE